MDNPVGRPRKDFCKNGHDLSIHRYGKGTNTQCRVCHKESQKKWNATHKPQIAALYRRYRESHREKVKNNQFANRLKKIYGINIDIYNQMLLEQNGRCSICFGHQVNSRKMCVDHDHETGTVRGLLCSNCNTALGLMQENKERLFKMIEYLEKSEAQVGQ